MCVFVVLLVVYVVRLGLSVRFFWGFVFIENFLLFYLNVLFV